MRAHERFIPGSRVVVADLQGRGRRRGSSTQCVAPRQCTFAVGADVGTETATVSDETAERVRPSICSSPTQASAWCRPESRSQMGVGVQRQRACAPVGGQVPAAGLAGRRGYCSTASAAGLLKIDSAAYNMTKRSAVAFAEWMSITYGDAASASARPAGRPFHAARRRSGHRHQQQRGAPRASWNPTEVAESRWPPSQPRRSSSFRTRTLTYLQRRTGDYDVGWPECANCRRACAAARQR